MRPLGLTAVSIEPGTMPCPLCGREFYQPFTELDLVKRVRRDVSLDGGAEALAQRIGLSATTIGRVMKGVRVSVDAWLRISRHYQGEEHQHAPLRVGLGGGRVIVGLQRSPR